MPTPRLAARQLDRPSSRLREREGRRPGREILSVDRAIRRPALCVIYRELKTKSQSERKVVAYRIGSIMLQYEPRRPVGRGLCRLVIVRHIPTLISGGPQSWPRKSGRDDKWSFCLTAGTLCPVNQERL